MEGLNLHQQIIEAIKKTDGIKVDIMMVESAENIRECHVEDVYDCTLIVSGTEDIKNLLLFLKQRKKGYIMLINQTPPPFLIKILEQKNVSYSFVLCKLDSNFNETLDDSLKHDIVTISDPCWRRILINKLSADNKVVYVVGKFKSLINLYKVVEECYGFSNSTLIRYVFFDEDPKTFNLSKYKSQLAKDLRINIHQNGEWVTFGLKSSTANTIHQAIDRKIFPFCNLRCPGIKLNVIGVNLADVSGTKKKIGVIEYAGEKDGKNVCGLATILDDSQSLHPDQQLFWTKPNLWSDIDVVSVLLAYSMAYYILKVDNHLEKGNNVYVSQGVLPLSQALIRIALKNGFKVYTSYKEVNQKDLIRQLFPEIPEDNIFNLNKKQIDATIQTKTHGKNMKVVVNSLPEPDMLERTLGMIGWSAKCYQISLPSMKSDETIGMFAFMKQLTLIGLSPESLLMIPDCKKTEIKNLVTQGFQSGEIKPLQSDKFTAEGLNIDAVSVLMDKLSIHKKVVINLENKLETTKSLSSYYTASPDYSYLIIGDNRNLWIHVCQWLIKRGAQNIYLLLEKNTFACSSNQQFNSILRTNPFLNLNLLSMKRFKDVNSTNSTLKEINSLHHLSAIFAVGKENEETVKNLCVCEGQFLVVSLCAGAETECEDRASSGLPSLAICASDDLLKFHIILPLLDPLLAQKKSVVYISELKGTQAKVHDLTMAEYFQSLPSTPTDLLQLVNNAKMAGWKEVRTNGFKTIHSREVDPVFILPTLKKSRFECIIQSLMHPAYEAIIPSDSDKIKDIAKQLSQGIMKFKQNEITLICSDWAWSLGLAIAQYLEEEEKVVCIIAIDSLAKRTSKSIIQNYFSDIKMKSVQNQKESILRGLKTLENRLDLMYYSNANFVSKYKGFFHILKPESQESYNVNKLQQDCERQIRIHSIPSSNLSSMCSDKKTTNLINSLILFEHKTAGRKVNKQYIERSVIEHAWKATKGLQRIQ